MRFFGTFISSIILATSISHAGDLDERVRGMNAVGCGSFSFLFTTYFTLTHYQDGNNEAMLANGHATVQRSLLMKGLFKEHIVSPEDRARIIEKMDEVQFEAVHRGDQLLLEKRGGQTIAYFTGRAGKAELDSLEEGLFGRVLNEAKQRIRWQTHGCN